MRRRPAHIKVFYRCFVVRPTRHRPQKEKLLQRKFALKNISLCQTKFSFQVQRRQHLPPHNNFLDVRYMLADRIDNVVPKRFTLLIVPGTLSQLVRRVLHEARHNVLPGWRY